MLDDLPNQLPFSFVLYGGTRVRAPTAAALPVDQFSEMSNALERWVKSN